MKKIALISFIASIVTFLPAVTTLMVYAWSTNFEHKAPRWLDAIFCGIYIWAMLSLIVFCIFDWGNIKKWYKSFINS